MTGEETTERDLPEQLEVLRVQEEEQRRMAEELHDGLCQSLAAAALSIDRLHDHLQSDLGAAELELTNLRQQVRDMTALTRQVVEDLYPTTVPYLGLEAALRAHCANLGAREELTVHLDLRLEREIHDERSVAFYRIAREALRNVIRHSGAREAKLQLQQNAHELQMVLTDSGRGFDPVLVQKTPGQGLGLAGMRARARLVGGEVRIASVPELGARVEVTLPVGESSEEEDTEPAFHDRSIDTIGSYRLLRRLGEGGMGTVYLGVRRLPPCEVALKVLPSRFAGRQERLRFEIEGLALARLDHPNVARVYETGVTEDGGPFIAMELVPGPSILEHCDQQRLDLRQRLELFLDVCDGVEHAHGKGVLHRDLKPSNILIAEEEEGPTPKIIDFGLAKSMHHPFNEAATDLTGDRLIGTPSYLSPEAIRKQPTGPEADVYSLGMLLYKLLIGTLPFETEGEDLMHLLSKIVEAVELPKPSERYLALLTDRADSLAWRRNTERAELTHDLSGDLDRIVMRALSADLQHRYSNVRDMAADIQHALRHLAAVAVERSQEGK